MRLVRPRHPFYTLLRHGVYKYAVSMPVLSGLPTVQITLYRVVVFRQLDLELAEPQFILYHPTDCCCDTLNRGWLVNTLDYLGQNEQC